MGLLLFVLLMVLLFGGLGIFVAKVFLILALVTLLLGAGGGLVLRGRAR